jgi:ligand-binding sensor domain-containing protein
MKLENKSVSSADFFFRDIYETEDQKIWLTSYNGLFPCEGDSCRNYLIEKDVKKVLEDPYQNRSRNIASHDHKDSIYVSSLKGLYTFNLTTHQFKKQAFGSSTINKVAIKGQKQHFSRYMNEVLIYNKDDQLLNRIDIAENHIIHDLFIDRDEILWICIDHGLFSFNQVLIPILL